VELLKGTLEVLILTTLRHGRMHGYAISRWIRESTDEVLAVEEGALYPALRRMEQRGLLKSAWSRTETGRRAKFYELTVTGRARLEEQRASWEKYVKAMAQVLN
jgi:transcriptional regulator